MFSIRLAGSGDYSAVCSLYAYYFGRLHDILPEVFSKIPKNIFTRSEYKDLISDESSRLYLAFSEQDAPVGLIALSLSNHSEQNAFFVDENRQYVDDLIVLPEYATTALPGLLLAKAEELAKENGVKWISSVIYPATLDISEYFKQRGYAPLSVRVQKNLDTLESPTF